MYHTEVKRHWYDGWFYAHVIDSGSNDFRERLIPFISEGSHVIDIGCGTGGFDLKLAKHCAHVVGVDISQKQIDQALQRKKESGLENITFKLADASGPSDDIAEKYDFAILSYVLHEMDFEDRRRMVLKLASLAEKIVILDYQAPHPWNFWGIMTRVIEFIAGRRHFRNFKDYLRRGGLNDLFQEAGLVIEEEKTNRSGIFRTVVVKAAL